MKHIEINIWKACNNKCRFCMSAFLWEKDKKLTDFKFVKEEIEKYSKKEYDSIGFLWWDISIHPQIYEIINESKKNWFKNINVITNAMIFSDYEKSKKLVLSGVTRINISVHSHIHEIEDYITQVQWWLKMKLKAIDNFNNLYYNEKLLKSHISINIVLNWENYKSIVETCLFFYKVKKISDIRINFLWNRVFFSEEDKKRLELKYMDILPYLKKMIVISLKTDLRITFEGIPACIFNKLWLPNLDLIIKTFLWEEQDYIEEISNINQNITFNWKSQKKDELKIKFNKCDKCLYFDRCQWVWKEYVNKYWNKEFNIIN